MEPRLAPEVAARDGEAPAARLRAAIARVSRRLRPTGAAGSLTATEVDMLVVAERHGPARMSDLAAFCGLNPTMVSRMVPRLVDLGLLARRADAADRRVCLVDATEEARALLQRVRSEREDVLSGLIDQLAEDDQRALAAATPVLETLAEALCGQPRAEGTRR
ncbi:MAG TPA: MarR family transcriptional regulator [Acidimicrobiales bacterium]|nr:MarR family transcriptional regulator [Acidimicrobiales bacterium]